MENTTNTTDYINNLKATVMRGIAEILDNIDIDDFISIAADYISGDFYDDINDCLNSYSPREIIEAYENNNFDLYAEIYRDYFGDIEAYDDRRDVFDFDDFARSCIDNDDDYNNDDIRELLDDMQAEIDEINAVNNAIEKLHDMIDELLAGADKLTIEQIKGAIIEITDEKYTNY